MLVKKKGANVRHVRKLYVNDSYNAFLTYCSKVQLYIGKYTEHMKTSY